MTTPIGGGPPSPMPHSPVAREEECALRLSRILARGYGSEVIAFLSDLDGGQFQHLIKVFSEKTSRDASRQFSLILAGALELKMWNCLAVAMPVILPRFGNHLLSLGSEKEFREIGSRFTMAQLIVLLDQLDNWWSQSLLALLRCFLDGYLRTGTWISVASFLPEVNSGVRDVILAALDAYMALWVKSPRFAQELDEVCEQFTAARLVDVLHPLVRFSVFGREVLTRGSAALREKLMGPALPTALLMEDPDTIYLSPTSCLAAAFLTPALKGHVLRYLPMAGKRQIRTILPFLRRQDMEAFLRGMSQDMVDIFLEPLDFLAQEEVDVEFLAWVDWEEVEDLSLFLSYASGHLSKHLYAIFPLLSEDQQAVLVPHLSFEEIQWLLSGAHDEQVVGMLRALSYQRRSAIIGSWLTDYPKICEGLWKLKADLSVFRSQISRENGSAERTQTLLQRVGERQKVLLHLQASQRLLALAAKASPGQFQLGEIQDLELMPATFVKLHAEIQHEQTGLISQLQRRLNRLRCSHQVVEEEPDIWQALGMLGVTLQEHYMEGLGVAGFGQDLPLLGLSTGADIRALRQWCLGENALRGSRDNVLKVLRQYLEQGSDARFTQLWTKLREQGVETVAALHERVAQAGINPLRLVDGVAELSFT